MCVDMSFVFYSDGVSDICQQKAGGIGQFLHIDVAAMSGIHGGDVAFRSCTWY